MRVQCDVCEKAPAEVVCYADEAVLCLSCDQRVHAANKLASKHQRLRLLHNLPDNSNPLPRCDICQEKDAFIFCLEDRALLCRDCDVCIHAANTLAARHQRFLATGIQVALESELHPVDDGSHPPKPEAPQPPSCTSHVVNPACTNYSSSSPNSSKRIAGKESLITEFRDGAEEVAKPAQEWSSIKRLDLEDLASDYPLGDIDFSKTDVVALGDQGLVDGHIWFRRAPVRRFFGRGSASIKPNVLGSCAGAGLEHQVQTQKRVPSINSRF